MRLEIAELTLQPLPVAGGGGGGGGRCRLLRFTRKRITIKMFIVDRRDQIRQQIKGTGLPLTKGLQTLSSCPLSNQLFCGFQTPPVREGSGARDRNEIDPLWLVASQPHRMTECRTTRRGTCRAALNGKILSDQSNTHRGSPGTGFPRIFSGFK